MISTRAQCATGSNVCRRERIDLDLVSVDLGVREQIGEAYKAVNPRQQVPALLLDDGT